MRQSNVLHLLHGQRDIRIKIDVPDDGAAGVQDSVDGPRLGGSWVVAGGRAMPVTTKVGFSVNFKALITFGVQRNYLSPFSLEILRQVDYCVSV